MSEMDRYQQESIEVAVLRIAKKRGITLSLLSAETDIPEPTLRAYANGTNGLSWQNAKKLIRALPADLGSLLIEDTGYRLAPIEARGASWLALGERMAQFTGKILHFQGTGGGIDPREHAELREDVLVIISEGQGAATK
jgi:hypothetical protein